MYRRRRSPPGPSHNSHEGEPWLTSSSPSVSMLSVLAGLSVWSWPSVSGGKIVASSKRRTNTMPFTLATKEIGYVKGSFYGPPGTGKTTILAMILIHLSKTYHNSAPVAWLASEKGVDFVLDMFKLEGVPLLVSRSRSFVDLRAATRDAKEAGACASRVAARRS